MKKGYWLIRVDIIQSDIFAEYASKTGPVLAAYGGNFLVRAGRSESLEGNARSRNSVIEFPSYQEALDCYHSASYQALVQLRTGACDMDILVIEGMEIAD
jgi:uncharacterized protein (DUF1330 family)